MKVYWEGRELADLTYNTAGQSLTNLSWRYHSYVVTTRTNSSTIKFQSLTFNFLGPALDDVSLIPYNPPPLEVNLNAVLTVVGHPGATYRIEYSTTPDNPAAWQTLCEIKILSVNRASCSVTQPPSPLPGAFIEASSSVGSNQAGALQQAAEFLLRNMMMRSFRGGRIVHRFVFYFKSLEVNNPQILIPRFPELALLKLEHIRKDSLREPAASIKPD